MKKKKKKVDVEIVQSEIIKLDSSNLGRLSGARFRDLNERLYSGLGSNALKEFTTDPSLFEQYHQGFRHQAQQWPESPVELISQLLLRPVFSKAQIADLGCGDAKLAEIIGQDRVASFDLIADPSRGIKKANINSYIPLPNENRDITVICLALMGQDCGGAIREAWRILRPGGLLLVAEVTSRFESVQSFIQQLEKSFGFKKLNLKGFGPSPGNNHFFLLPFQKKQHPPMKNVVLNAKVCIYKKR